MNLTPEHAILYTGVTILNVSISRLLIQYLIPHLLTSFLHQTKPTHQKQNIDRDNSEERSKHYIQELVRILAERSYTRTQLSSFDDAAARSVLDEDGTIQVATAVEFMLQKRLC